MVAVNAVAIFLYYFFEQYCGMIECQRIAKFRQSIRDTLLESVYRIMPGIITLSQIEQCFFVDCPISASAPSACFDCLLEISEPEHFELDDVIYLAEINARAARKCRDLVHVLKAYRPLLAWELQGSLREPYLTRSPYFTKYQLASSIYNEAVSKIRSFLLYVCKFPPVYIKLKRYTSESSTSSLSTQPTRWKVSSQG